MCGLAGIASFNGARLGEDTRSILAEMGRRLAHRGPDDERIQVSAHVGMVFRRLSIVDLDGGAQPLTNEDGSLVLMVNGEIYNHRELRSRLRTTRPFRSQSDCEVIIHLYEQYGIDCLKMLNGMFSLCLWDRRIDRLYLARDPLGVKPLFYALLRDRLIFGSEIKALFADPACPAQLDWWRALSYKSQALKFGAGTPLCSFFEGVEQLEGGTCLELNLNSGRVEKSSYWTLPRSCEIGEQSACKTEEDFISGYRDLLEDSIQKQLMADVELGVFLSGGIDSVAIAMFASKQQQFHTFTVLGQSTFGNGDAESAHMAARLLGVPNHQALFEWHSLNYTADDWRRLLWLVESPFTNAEQLYKYQLHRFARRVRPQLKVVLVGQGSDEFNGGYCRSWLVETGKPVSGHNWAGFLEMLAGFETEEMTHSGLSKANRYIYSFKKPLVRRQYLADMSGCEIHDDPWRIYLERNRNMLQMYNLWHEDRTASGNGIENRVPYLDHRLVEYLCAVPDTMRQRLFWDKSILRRAVAEHLPESLRNREKVPFFNGADLRYTERMIYRVLSDDNGSLIDEVLSDKRSSEIFDRDAVWEAFKRIGRDPAYRGTSLLLEAVNMGLLDIMASNSREASVKWPCVDVPEMSIDSWTDRKEAIQVKLAARRRNIDPDHVLAFAPNTFLVRRDSTDGRCVAYIVVNFQIKYVLNTPDTREWAEVLRRIDGERSLNDILQAAGISEARIRKNLEEALDFNVVTLKEPVVATAH